MYRKFDAIIRQQLDAGIRNFIICPFGQDKVVGLAVRTYIGKI